ncbi:uncharacterized protein LOC134237068 [Saccostrea cucullata]|uniref:uncharacterized protein LOC134237068 n=1 Tax=Saccostrea cuccullata TaxID=36930 RepID=UPI002ED04F66
MPWYLILNLVMLASFYIHMTHGIEMDNDCISECKITKANITDIHLLSQYDKPLKTVSISLFLGLKENNCSTKNQCLLNSTRILEHYNFGDESIVSVFNFQCFTPLIIQITPYSGRHKQNIISYIQVIKCQMTEESFYILGSMVLPFHVLLKDTNLAALESSGTNKTMCNLMKQVTTLWIVNEPSQENVTDLEDIINMFRCSHDFPKMKDLTIQNININTSVFDFSVKLPNLVSLELSQTGLRHPIRFPWSDSSPLLSYNLSSSDYLLNHYAKSLHITVEKHHFRKYLNLNMNNISSLQDYEFEGWLQALKFTGNGLTELPENLFRKLKEIEHIDMSLNNIQRLPSSLFRGLTLLKHLDAHANNLTEIQMDLFVDNKELIYIDFSRNKIERIHKNAFRYLDNLQELHLKNNNIISLENLEWPLYSTKLEFLYFDGNPLIHLPAEIFYLRALKMASFKYTQIHFTNFTNYLNNLDFSTIAEQLLKGAVPKNDVSFNVIVKNPNLLLVNILDRNRKIDLTGSRIDNLNIEYFGEQQELKERSGYIKLKLLLILKFFEIILEGTHLRCDCGIIHISRLVTLLKNDGLFDGKEYFFNDWKCFTPQEFKGKTMWEIREADTYCERNITNCPTNCTCYSRSVTSITIVDCRNRHFQTLPKILPTGIVDLWFQQNNISTISDDNLQYLPYIRQLYLSENQLTSISDGAISKMTLLSSLYVDSNYLVSLPRALQSKRLMSISFINNPLKCDCHTKWIKHWVLRNTDMVEHVSDITCNVDDEAEKGNFLIRIPDQDFVCLEDFDSIKHVVIPSVTSSLILVLLIILLCLMYVYRLEVKVLLYIYLGIHPFDKDDKDGKEIIDVLVLHAPDTTEWVMENVVKYLEFQKEYYVVCEMMRDFVAGFTYMENIASIVKHSKRMLIILSPEFIEDDLLKVAWNEAQEKIKELRTNYAIVVCHDVVLKQVMIKDMQRYIKRGRYIDANQALFHEKLLYSMPQYEDQPGRGKSLPDIKAFIQATYGEEGINNDMYKRHAFVSYSDSEMPYIMNELRPTLENNGYLLCLPDRDFVPGASKEENILKAIDSSLHTIFILSGNHLEDEWSVFTFRIASEKSLRVRSNHLIVIIGEDADLETMDEEVRFYIKTHVTLRVNEKWFMKKLLNSLPEVEAPILDMNYQEDDDIQYKVQHKPQKEREPKRVVAEINHRENEDTGMVNGMGNGHAGNGTVKFIKNDNHAYVNDEDYQIEFTDIPLDDDVYRFGQARVKMFCPTLLSVIVHLITIVSSIEAFVTGSDTPEVKSKVNHCNISECHLRMEKISTARVRNRMDIPLKVNGKRINIDNKDSCTINSTLLRENLDMKGGGPGIELISFKCTNNISIHFSSDRELFHHEVFIYLQVLTCSTSMDSLFELKSSLGSIYSLELDRTPKKQTSCSYSYRAHDVCKTLESVHSIKLLASALDDQHNNITRLFNCSGKLPLVRELTLKNWHIDKHAASFLEHKFPLLQNLEISFSSMKIPPQFPWDEANRTFPFNFTESPYTRNHYLHSYHVVLPRQFYRRTLTLNSNSITDLSNFHFKGYIQLLDLSNNKLQVLDENSFTGLQGLQHLNLKNNRLKTITNRSWRTLTSLRHLDLHNNDIREIQSDLFEYNQEMEYLDLSNNKINTIEESCFTHLSQLKELHLESNNIVNLPSIFLPFNPLNFQFLYLDRNPLVDFPLPIVYYRSLEKVSLRHTNIDLHEFRDNDLLLSINYYALRSSVAKWSEENIKGSNDKSPERLRKIDVSGSRVENVQLDVFNYGTDANEFKHLIWRLSIILKHFEFILDGINLQCDCRINQFNRFVQEALNRKLLSGREYFFTDWKCSSPLEFKDKPLVSIKEWETYCVTIVPHCPRNCTCLKRSVSGVIIVDCRQRGYFSLPDQLPDGILDLWFQHNNISVIRNIDYLDRIRQLYLSHNQIVEIENDAIENMHNISHLYVDSNNLVVMPTRIQIRDITNINIDNNPFKCDCNSLWMKHWLLLNSDSFSDVMGITCNIDDENEKGTKFVNIPDSEFICLDEYNTLQDLIIPISFSTFSITLIIISICFINIFIFEVKVLMFLYFGIHPFDLDDDKSREAVDVLVVHAPGLTNWVMENIVDPLEAQKTHFVVCEMMRDFIPGFSIQDNFESIVKNSKRMILVLSPEILGDPLLKLIWSQAQEKIKELRSNYVIMVYYNLNAKDITNEDMLRYVKHNKTMTSSDRLLRQKLLYCMPVICEDTVGEDQRLQIKHCVKKMYSEEIGKLVLFERHVFISYSIAEIRCLLDDIIPLLEDSGYILCLPDRDFVPGASQEENILRAIDTCLHTIFFLSSDHLQDEWSIFTFRTAWEKSLRNKSNYLIVILSEDVELDDMDDEIRYHVETHVTLQIGDEWFATKLLNSLVDVNAYTQCPLNENNRQMACCLDYDEQSVTDSMLFGNRCDVAVDSRIQNDYNRIQIEEETPGRRVISVDIHRENDVENMSGIRFDDNEDFINEDEHEENNATCISFYRRENCFQEEHEKYACKSITEDSASNEFRSMCVNNNREGEINFNIKEEFHLNVTEDEENLSDIKNENVDSRLNSNGAFGYSKNCSRLNIQMEIGERNIYVSSLSKQVNLKNDSDVSDCDVSDSDNNTDSESDN